MVRFATLENVLKYEEIKINSMLTLRKEGAARKYTKLKKFSFFQYELSVFLSESFQVEQSLFPTKMKHYEMSLFWKFFRL